jgi:hypothetical protein
LSTIATIEITKTSKEKAKEKKIKKEEEEEARELQLFSYPDPGKPSDICQKAKIVRAVQRGGPLSGRMVGPDDATPRRRLSS